MSGPEPAAATVSVVIVAYGRPDLLARTIGSLRSTAGSSVELIIVDNPTVDGPVGLPELPDGARVIRNERNVGFGAAVDQAALVASGRVLALVNPDVELTVGWLDPLLAHLDADPGVVAVSPRLVDPDGTTQEIGSVVGPAGETLALGRGPAAELAQDPVTRPVDFVSAACLLVTAEAFLAEGGFDAAFGAGYFEDVDLLFRFARRGWRTEVVPAVPVVHHRHGTSSDAEAGRLMDERRHDFVQRWRTELNGRPSLTDVASRPHRLRSARELRRPDRLLVLAQGLPVLTAIGRGLAELRPELAVTIVSEAPPGALGDRVELVPPGALGPGWFAAHRLVFGTVLASTLVPSELLSLVDGYIDPLVRLVHGDDLIVDALGGGSLPVPPERPGPAWFEALALLVGLAPADPHPGRPPGRFRAR
ncbi:MAG: glycosyltransferase family 2 protein [Actinomycetota bacterium]